MILSVASYLMSSKVGGRILKYYLSNFSLVEPQSFFYDKTNAVIDFKKRINSNELSLLAIASDTHMIPDILCTYGCTEICVHSSFIKFDLMW